jgi:hypothetical protein
VRVCGYPKADGKPCQQTILTENGLCRKHADGAPGPGAPHGNTNAVGHGAPPGNENARTHGLFAKSIGQAGMAAYTMAENLTAQELARETAEFIIAKVAEACSVDRDMLAAHDPVHRALKDLVKREEITERAYERIMDRLYQPDLVALGKFMGPLKGLLEVKKAKDDGTGKDDPVDRLMEALAASRRHWQEAEHAMGPVLEEGPEVAG